MELSESADGVSLNKRQTDVIISCHSQIFLEAFFFLFIFFDATCILLLEHSAVPGIKWPRMPL